MWNETLPTEPTPVYRHVRCHFCSKPVPTTSIKYDCAILCHECAPNVIEDDVPVETTEKQGYETRDRDDEEEWGGIPIPQSDDSQSSGDYLSDDTEEEEDEGVSLASQKRSDDR